MILAYIRTNGIVSAQLWMSDFSKQIEVRLGTIIKQIEINDEDSNLNLDDLKNAMACLKKALEVYPNKRIHKEELSGSGKA